MARILFLVNHIPFFLTHRLPLARAAREAGHDIRVAHGGREPPDVLDGEGIPHTRLPFARAGFRLAEYATAPGRLAGLYGRFKPDLVHAFPLKMVLYAARAGQAALRRGLRPPALAGSVTGLGYLFTDHRWAKRLLRRAVMDRLRAGLARTPGARIIVQNNDDLGLLLDLRVAPPHRIVLVPGAGVDCREFAPPAPGGPEWERDLPPAPGLAPADHRPIVALPARMLRDKGICEFAEAARRLRAGGAEARFVLAGNLDGENPASLDRATLRGWEAEGAVEWAGWVRDMPALWRASAVACLPSYREGCPKALLEAMAAGRPCVATDVPGCREAVRDGVNGRLVPVRDAGALAAALEEAIGSPESRRRWGAAGRRLAEERFALPRVVAATFGAYGEALREAGFGGDG